MNRVPPHSVQAEQNVLGAMLIDPEARAKAQRLLDEQDFYLEKHRAIFRAISTVSEPDIVSVGDAIKGQPDIMEYLAHIASSLQTTAAVVTHSTLVKEKAQYRKMIDAANAISDSAFQENMPVIDLKGYAYELIDIKTEQSVGVTMQMAIENYRELLKRRVNRPGADIKTGIPWLDRHTNGFPPGAMVVLAARPSVGKTTLATLIVKHNALNGKRVLFFSLEMSVDQIIDKMVASHAGVDANALKNPKSMTEPEIKLVGEAMQALKQSSLVINDEAEKIEEIVAIAKQEKAERGVDLVAIDYLQNMETRRRFKDEYDKISHLSGCVKSLAKSLKCPVLVLSQLKRSEGKNDEPTLSMLKGSGDIEADADIVLFLHDPDHADYENTKSQDDMDVKLIIGKQREGVRDIATMLRYQKPQQRMTERAYQPRPQKPQKAKGPKGEEDDPW